MKNITKYTKPIINNIFNVLNHLAIIKIIKILTMQSKLDMHFFFGTNLHIQS